MVRRTRVHENLVNEAKQARRAVQQKVRRVERSTGAKLTEYGYNPNTGIKPSDYSNLTTPQLRRHIAEQKRFLDRGNQFVAGDRGAPISRSTWNKIESAQEQINARAREYVERYGGIEVPGTGMDIEGRLDARKVLNKYRAGGQRKTFEEVNRQASGITGEESAQEILAGLQNQLKGSYLNKRMRIQRDNLKVMLETTGDEDIAKKIDRLTNNQLNILIDYSYFMTAVGGRYDYQKSLNVAEQKNAKNHWTYSEYQDNEKRLNDLIDWAGTLPKSTNRPTKWDSNNTNVGQIPTQFNPGNTNVGKLPRQYNPRDTNARSIPTQFNPNDTTARSIPTQKPKRGKSK